MLPNISNAAIKAHNEYREFPTANEHYNSDYKLGTRQERLLLKKIAFAKHGFPGTGKVTRQDVNRYLPSVY